ncbi:MAG: GWxTD domain-containing protein [Acidobacteria bacterium]|nr:GWxTD domain-containing protein [Acidobacteriota bacterium]
MKSLLNLKKNRIVWVFVVFSIFGVALAQSGKAKKESERDYYKKWLEEDVLYIITDEEKDVFKKLQSDEEKENFIEQFWARRDPTPESSHNEFKEEHYRRIQYANDHFSSGIPGWKLDRGRTYIMFGPPDRIESYPSGGHYNRPSWEGGGSTSTVPFERWEYRYLEGVGQDIEIEFVDQSLSGEYRMTMNPDDKDALLHVPGAGMTDAELLGYANRVDRIVRKTSPMPGNNPLLIGYGRVKDQPFEKLLTFTNLQRPPAVKFRDLQRQQTLVTMNISYQLLPFELRADHLAIDHETYMVPITVMVPHKELQYAPKDQVQRAVVGIYGQVTSLSGKIVTVFEESLVTESDEKNPAENARLKSIYQKSLQLPSGRYKLDVIVRDENSQKLGSQTLSLILDKNRPEDLNISSVVLANRIDLAETSGQPSPFGPAKVFPNIDGVFRVDQPLLVFFQLSHFKTDSARQAPDLISEMKIIRDDREVLREQLHIDNAAAQQYEDRVHVIHQASLKGMEPGKYQLHLQVSDQISGQQLERRVPFQIAVQ